MKKIKIAHVAGGLTTGGVEAVIYNYFSHMDTAQYELVYISYDTPDPKVKERFEALGFTVYTVTKKKENFIKSCREVFCILKKHDIQIIHSHMTLMCFITNIIGMAAGVKVRISHSHLVERPSGKLKKYIFCIYKYLSRVTATDYFTCSHDAGIYLFGQKAYASGKIHLLNNAFSISSYAYDKALADQSRKENNFENTIVIGNVGRFTEQKNQEFILDIFKIFHSKCPDSRLLFVGSGPMMEEIESRVRHMGLEGYVIFTGSVTHPEKWYMSMDIFLFPSRYEGLGIAAVEAQAASLPVLASEAVPRGIVVSENVEFLPLTASPEVWAAQLQKLLDTRNLPRRHTQRLTDSLRKHHYDINQEVAWLDLFYKKAQERS